MRRDGRGYLVRGRLRDMHGGLEGVGEALAEIGLKIDQAKSNYVRNRRTGWRHENLEFLGNRGDGEELDESRRGRCYAGDGTDSSDPSGQEKGEATMVADVDISCRSTGLRCESCEA